MATDFLKHLYFAVILILLQVLVLNKIHIMGCATPLLFILMPLRFSNTQPRWSILLWCFTIGLTTDIFSNTPGVGSASMTVVGLLQPYIFRMFIDKADEDETITPSLKTLNWMKYITYSFTLTFILCLIFFTLEAFSFFDITLWLSSIGGSTLLTFLMILAIEKIRAQK